MAFIVGVGLTMPAIQLLVLKYFQNNQIPIVVLAPVPDAVPVYE